MAFECWGSRFLVETGIAKNDSVSEDNSVTENDPIGEQRAVADNDSITENDPVAEDDSVTKNDSIGNHHRVSYRHVDRHQFAAAYQDTVTLELARTDESTARKH